MSKSGHIHIVTMFPQLAAAPSPHPSPPIPFPSPSFSPLLPPKLFLTGCAPKGVSFIWLLLLSSIPDWIKLRNLEPNLRLHTILKCCIKKKYLHLWTSLVQSHRNHMLRYIFEFESKECGSREFKKHFVLYSNINNSKLAKCCLISRIYIFSNTDF